MKIKSYKHMIKWAAKEEYNNISDVLAEAYDKNPERVEDDIEAECEKRRKAARAQLAEKYRCVTCKDQKWYWDNSACDYGGPKVKISCETCGTGKIIWNRE